MSGRKQLQDGLVQEESDEDERPDDELVELGSGPLARTSGLCSAQPLAAAGRARGVGGSEEGDSTASGPSAAAVAMHHMHVRDPISVGRAIPSTICSPSDCHTEAGEIPWQEAREFALGPQTPLFPSHVTVPSTSACGHAADTYACGHVAETAERPTDASHSAEADPLAVSAAVEYERTLAWIEEVFVYRIPPLSSSAGHICESWGLSNPLWTGSLKLVGVGEAVYLLFLHRENGEFARTPRFDVRRVGLPGGPRLSALLSRAIDSSRYFVVRVVHSGPDRPHDAGHGVNSVHLESDVQRGILLGFGFRERNSAFEMNAAIDDWIRQVQRQSCVNAGRQLCVGAGHVPGRVPGRVPGHVPDSVPAVGEVEADETVDSDTLTGNSSGAIAVCVVYYG